jgi:diacylglycerol kinase
MLRFFKSFGYAINGFRFSLREQLNIKIQIAVAIMVVALAFYFDVSRIEWIVLLLCIALVLSLEMINTALEDMVDLVSPQYNPIAGKIKDIAAASVLLSSIIAAIIGAIVFYPYCFN